MFETSFVRGDVQGQRAAVGVAARSETRMRISRSNCDDRSFSQQHVPSAHEIVRAIEQCRQGGRPTKWIRQQGLSDCWPSFIAPLTVAVEPFDPIE